MLYPRPEDNTALVAALKPQGEASFPIPISAAKPIEKSAIGAAKEPCCHSNLVKAKPVTKVTPAIKR